MNEIVLSNYGPTFAAQLADAPLNELGPGKPLAAQRKKLEALSIDTDFAPHKVVERTMAKACLAGLWLRFDFLDESHSISQEIKTPTGSFWHGILHRREPDFDNAKYWFHRVGEHPVFAPLCAAAWKITAATNPAEPAAKFLTAQTRVGPVPLHQSGRCRDTWQIAQRTTLPRNPADRMGTAVRLLLPRSDRASVLTASSPVGSCRWAIMQYGLSRSSRVFDRISGGWMVSNCRRFIAAIMAGCLLCWPGYNFADEPATKPAEASKANLADAKPVPNPSKDEEYELYKSLADTLDQVERNYVKPIDRRELLEAAIKGMLTKLDPYSSYISPEEMSSFRTSVENQFGGIGVQVTVDQGQLKVSSPLVGTPAYRAGVQPGDRILEIDGESTRNIALDEAVKKLKGEVGTTVNFTVRHPLTGENQSFAIQRENIHVDTVLGNSRKADNRWDFLLDHENRIGYIRLTAFSRDTAADLKKAPRNCSARKCAG